MNKRVYLLCMVIVAGGIFSSLAAQKNELRFRADKTFKIVQFTDIHYVPGNPASEEAIVCMTEVLDAEKPDFVIYTGDVIFEKPAREAFTAALQPVVDRNIPFGVVLGNHDDEFDMTRKEILDYLKTFPGNLTDEVTALSGVTNFILPVMDTEGEKEAALLYCIDSHAYSTLEGIKGYDWVKQDQINWYTTNSRNYTRKNRGKPLPALAFFHIPFPEYNQAAYDETTLLIGSRLEKACSPELNTGLFTAFLEGKDVMATFVGHDHVNDYVTLWKGMLLCYGRFTGGNTVYNGLPGGNGARVIELKEGERGFRTWIRLKENQVINSIYFPNDSKK